MWLVTGKRTNGQELIYRSSRYTFDLTLGNNANSCQLKILSNPVTKLSFYFSLFRFHNSEISLFKGVPKTLSNI